MVHLILVFPVPRIQEQMVAGQGVHFAKVISTTDAMVTLFKAEHLSTSEIIFDGEVAEAQAIARGDVPTASHTRRLHDERIRCSFDPSMSVLLRTVVRQVLCASSATQLSVHLVLFHVSSQCFQQGASNLPAP